MLPGEARNSSCPQTGQTTSSPLTANRSGSRALPAALAAFSRRLSGEGMLIPDISSGSVPFVKDSSVNESYGSDQHPVGFLDVQGGADEVQSIRYRSIEELVHVEELFINRDRPR